MEVGLPQRREGAKLEAIRLGGWGGVAVADISQRISFFFAPLREADLNSVL
jgi:hypothetical protein